MRQFIHEPESFWTHPYSYDAPKRLTRQQEFILGDLLMLDSMGKTPEWCAKYYTKPERVALDKLVKLEFLAKYESIWGDVYKLVPDKVRPCRFI